MATGICVGVGKTLNGVGDGLDVVVGEACGIGVPPGSAGAFCCGRAVGVSCIEVTGGGPNCGQGVDVGFGLGGVACLTAVGVSRGSVGSTACAPGAQAVNVINITPIRVTRRGVVKENPGCLGSN